MREKMVETQIQARGVKDPRVLSALRKVERHQFVPKAYLDSAYSDQPLPIGEGQTISQPYIVALMTALLELKGGEKVLEVGTGSGYQAAILAELAKEVYSIEIVETLASMAKNRLLELGYQNIKVKAGDGYLGWPEAAPFDCHHHYLGSLPYPETSHRTVKRRRPDGRARRHLHTGAKKNC